MTRIPSLRLLVETPRTDPESGINSKKKKKSMFSNPKVLIFFKDKNLVGETHSWEHI